MLSNVLRTNKKKRRNDQFVCRCLIKRCAQLARKGKYGIAVNRFRWATSSPVRNVTLWYAVAHAQPNLTALICEFIGVAGTDTRSLHVLQLRHLRINSGFVSIKENRVKHLQVTNAWDPIIFPLWFRLPLYFIDGVFDFSDNRNFESNGWRGILFDQWVITQSQ